MHSQTTLSYSLIEDLYLKNRNFCSNDYDECLKYLKDILPFEIHSYQEPFNLWQIPPRWNLKHAFIKNTSGDILYTVDHPLKIIGLSTSFSQRVSQQELLKHLHYDHRMPDAIAYHFRQYYRPWERTWGFCVPKTFYDSLQEDHYDVEIVTEESKGEIQVAEYTKKGDSPYSFAFVAHLDHPGMVNDDLAGVAVGVELFKKLQNKKTKFTYKLILVPEIIGSEFFLGNLKDRSMILESCFLEMLGSKTEHALQRSLKGYSQLENQLLKALKNDDESFNTGPFKSIICNDEYIWEGYQIPMCSLSRFPYPEYHTHFDNLSILSPSSLSSSINILEIAIQNLEKLTLIEKHFSGTPCLSHPSYQLYVDPGQRAFGTHHPKLSHNKRLLMDLIPAQKKCFFLEDLLGQVEMSKSEALNYLQEWEAKKLISIHSF